MGTTTPTFTVTGTAVADNDNFGASIIDRLGTSIDRYTQVATLVSQGVRVAVPAIVQSFNPGPPATITAQIVTNEKVQWNPNGPKGPVDITVQPMVPGQVLVDIPVCIPSNGKWSMTFPIQPGDECILLFADTALDSWLSNGGVNNPAVSSRRHSLADAIAIFGVRSKPKGLDNYSTTSVQIRSNDRSVLIDLADTKITVTAPTVQVSAQTATVQASGNATVTGRSVDITGATAVNIKGNGSVNVDGKNFLAHRHVGVQTGGSVSGPVA